MDFEIEPIPKNEIPELFLAYDFLDELKNDFYESLRAYSGTVEDTQNLMGKANNIFLQYKNIVKTLVDNNNGLYSDLELMILASGVSNEETKSRVAEINAISGKSLVGAPDFPDYENQVDHYLLLPNLEDSSENWIESVSTFYRGRLAADLQAFINEY